MKKTLKPGKNKTPSSPANPPTKPENPIFPIVGIGASAGGLEALEQFLAQVPEKSDMAFVVVQHLDPTHQGMLAELLQRTTTMDVFQVSDRMRVLTNCVYVIPPNKDMSILHGVLHLFAPSLPRGLRLPIDYFLNSLAIDRREASIGVILSGMGSDGTAGLKAIKENAGVTLAQDPATAKFDSMPKSAIDAGVVDIVAPAAELCGKIIGYLAHTLVLAKPENRLAEKNRSGLEKIIILLRSNTGHDFSLYKNNTLYRRIERRMGVHQIDRISTYVRYLQENPQEVLLLFRELLIGVTSFFRDPAAWERLQTEILPGLLAERPAGGKLRAWSAGCSTGEEAYSLAILFKELIATIDPPGNFTLQIFATDLDRDAIDKARQGVYPASIAADLSPERLSRFFVPEGNSYRVGKEIRELVTFATQNLIMDPPFTKLDVLICRNLLIYLMPELQKKLLPLFHYSLRQGGVLFLGSSETISASPQLFEPISSRLRLFRRRELTLQDATWAIPDQLPLPLLRDPRELTTLKSPTPNNLQSLAEQLLLQHFAPPAVLVNTKGDIVYISGRTGKYLEPAAGKANWNIFAMAREGLRAALAGAFPKALRTKETVSAEGLQLGVNDGNQIVNISIRAINEPKELQGMLLIVFTDVAPPSEKKTALPQSEPSSVENDRVRELEQELHHFREVMRFSEEELKSANEELQSTNEELQSTNEELTTSREEMQSMNEELQTMNVEQQSKMDEQNRNSDDMRNLLNSTEIITIFLDNQLHIRRFTSGADTLFKLLPGDVGRPLSDIVSLLLYPEMSEEAGEVLRTLVFSEKQITTNDGRWFSVRIMPYRSMADLIGGVVITFTNITAAKKLEAELRKEIAGLKAQLKGETP